MTMKVKKSDYRKLVSAVIGRKLKPGETVHHINGNHYDNRIDNYYVFKNKRSHFLYHLKLGTLILGIYNCESDNHMVAYLKKKILPLRLSSNIYELMCEKREGEE